MSDPHISPLILRYCKRGHLRTEESTFPRKARVGGKDYIVRECRICHSLRANRTASWSKGQSNSKWRQYEAASGIAAPSGVETGNTDSTVGKSPTGEAGDAQ